jgi:hypothetical protein
MYASNIYAIRVATDADAASLRHLAALDSAAPLGGSVLIGDLAGAPAAAISIADGRVIADPFIPTAHLVATLRTRATGMRAVEETPSLRERIRAALAPLGRAPESAA